MCPTLPARSIGPETPMPTPTTSVAAEPGLVEHGVDELGRGVERRRGRVVDVELDAPLGEHRRREVGHRDARDAVWPK